VGLAAAIALAGTVLCRESDMIAAGTGLPRSLIGLTLLAGVTSLPELVVGISSVTLASLPEIAVANVFGSCLVNLGLLGVLMLFTNGERAAAVHARAHASSAGWGIVLLAIAGLGLTTDHAGAVAALGHVGYYTPMIALAYVLAIRHAPRDLPENLRPAAVSLRRAMMRAAVAATVVVGAGISLPPLAASIAQSMGWSQSFVGAMLVALATTLPEAAVTISAARMGALDLAIGNLLGSNLFDMAILALDDALFLEGPILAHVPASLGITVFAAIAMTALTLVGMGRRVGAALCASYLLAAWLLQHAAA
jgi:cation:H+ antiporter